MMLIRQDRGAARQEELRNNSPRAGERANELMLPEERDQLKEKLKAEGIDLDNPNFGEQERVAKAAQMVEFGKDQADWQIAQADDKDFDNKADKRLRQQVKDRGDLDINVAIAQAKGKPLRIEGVAPAGQPVPRELREAAMLQELGLAFPERKREVPYKKGKDGKRRRVFAREDRESGVLKEFRVGNDGPQGPMKIEVANAGGQEDAFKRLVAAVERGEVSLDDAVQFANHAPYPRRNVGEVLDRMGLQVFPAQENQRVANEVDNVFASERANRAERARQVLREKAELRKAQGNPMSRREAFEFLEQFKNGKAYSDREVREEAQGLIRNNSGFLRDLAKEDIGHIAEVAILGGAKDVDKGGNVQRIVFGQDIERADAIPMVGPKGNIVGFADENMQQFLGEVNTPDSANMANAPSLGRGQAWAAANVRPMGKEGGNFFGPNNIDLIAPGRNFMAAVKSLDGMDDLPDDIRNAAEFDNAVDRVIADVQGRGKQFFRPENGKQVVVETPGPEDVLRALRIPAQEQGKLADAIFRMEEMKARGINAGLREAFERRDGFDVVADDVIFDAPAMRDAEVKIGKVKNQKIKGKGVGAELRKIDGQGAERALREEGLLNTIGPNGKPVMLPNARDAIQGVREVGDDARMGLIGVAGGEEEPRAKFIKQKGRNMSPSERVKAYGPKNAEVMNEVERRYEEDRNLREQAAVPQSDPLAIRERAKDADFKAQGSKVMRDKEDLEIGQLFKQMKFGREFDAPADFRETSEGSGKMYRVEGAKRGELLRVPANIKPKQPIQQAATPTIAPTPGDITGSQPAPMADAGRGGWMGGGGNGRVVSPWDSPEPNRSNARMKFEPDGPSSNREDLINRIKRGATSNDPRMKRARRISYGAGGGLAVLGGILGLNNNRQEEEAVR